MAHAQRFLELEIALFNTISFEEFSFEFFNVSIVHYWLFYLNIEIYMYYKKKSLIP